MSKHRTDLERCPSAPKPDQFVVFCFVFFRFYLFIHETHTEREAETQAEGEASSMQGAQHGLDPGSPGSHPGPKAGAKPLSHPGCPVQ